MKLGPRATRWTGPRGGRPDWSKYLKMTTKIYGRVRCVSAGLCPHAPISHSSSSGTYQVGDGAECDVGCEFEAVEPPKEGEWAQNTH